MGSIALSMIANGNLIKKETIDWEESNLGVWV